MTAELQLRAAVLRVGTRDLLQDVSIDIRQGVSVVNGPGASGKTLVLEVLAGLLNPVEGRLLWRGASLSGAHLRAYREVRSYLPEVGCQELDLRVSDIFHAVAAMWRVAVPSPLIERELERWDLLHLRRARLRRLSGGERRRVLLGVSLIMNPKIWIVDRPFAELDAMSKVALQDLLTGVASGFPSIPGLRCIVLAGADLADLPRDAASWKIDPGRGLLLRDI